MKRFRRLPSVIATAFALCASGVGHAAATGDLWEVTTQMSMPGMPEGMSLPSQTRKTCAAKEWTKPPVSQDDRKCQFTDFQRTDTKATWKMSCEGMSGEGEIDRTGPDAYKGWMKMSAPQGTMVMNLTGRRIGDCDAGEAKKEREAQIAQIQAQATAGGKAAADAMKQSCSVATDGVDLQMWRTLEPMCTSPQAGLTAADYKAALCTKAKTYDGYKLLADREGDPTNDLAAVASFCGADPEAMTRSACEQAVTARDLNIIGKHCPAEAQAIAKAHCAGRSYTSMAGDPYASFCAIYAKDMMEGGAKARH